MGSGSQDIDMANRCKAFAGNQVFAKYQRGSIEDNHKAVGGIRSPMTQTMLGQTGARPRRASVIGRWA